MYYIEDSGVGRVFLIKNETGQSVKAGVIGLGAGALAGYGRKGDLYRFYEINPQVIELANTHFSFLSSTPATTEVILGDARLQLEKEPVQHYDVLVVDAFSGDSVPIHLLTKEAFEQYFRHLKQDGVLAVHITNRYLNLMPVMKTVADYYGKQAKLVKFEPIEGDGGFRSEWVIIANQPQFLAGQKLSNGIELNAPPNFKMWSDDYSSLISIMN
jgi:spermidine synthase